MNDYWSFGLKSARDFSTCIGCHFEQNEKWYRLVTFYYYDKLVRSVSLKIIINPCFRVTSSGVEKAREL